MSRVAERPLSGAEKAVVARLIELSGTRYALPARVVGRCDCGCASVDFALDGPFGVIIADAYGRTPAGIGVGVLLWARGSEISTLEVYMLRTDTGELPTVESLGVEPPAPAS